MAIIKKSALEELREEVPELFEHEDVVIKVVEDDDFDAYIEAKE